MNIPYERCCFARIVCQSSPTWGFALDSKVFRTLLSYPSGPEAAERASARKGRLAWMVWAIAQGGEAGSLK